MSTVAVPGDTAAPTTLDSSDERWHRLPYSLRLSASDIGGSGLARTEYRLDEQGQWQTTSGPITFTAGPGDHSLDGFHRIYYRSIDAAGNCEPTRVCGLSIDTTPPAVRAPRPVRARRGRWAKLPVRVSDVEGVTVTLTARIYDARGKRVRKITRRGYVNANDAIWFHCKLKPGRYRFKVWAVDAAGNQQSRIGSNTLTVRR
ncbi:MAG: hypothetical protein FJ000_03540 [Actinobacteria bacterium]|nr:hypothetical protein [Actinomycetota bacterium]